MTHTGLVFVRRFQDSLARNKLIPRGSKIIVAVSGGSDSIALLTLLVRLRDKHDFTLRVAHVNYRLRGRDSDRDEALVRKLCTDWSVPVSVLHPKERPTNNIEERLRVIRYRFFERVRKQKSFDCIATAHTMNDVAETLLMNLIRGAGSVGLSPLQRNATAVLVRPLVAFTKDELLTLLATEQIAFRHDRSNRSARFTRNRIRHEVLSLLETFNPAIIHTLAATAKRLQGQRAYRPAANASRLRGTYIFPRAALLNMSPDQRETALSHLFRALSPERRSPAQRFIQEIVRVIQSSRPGQKTLRSGHLKCTVFRARVEIAFC